MKLNAAHVQSLKNSVSKKFKFNNVNLHRRLHVNLTSALASFAETAT
jgi:hypothetical protein